MYSLLRRLTSPTQAVFHVLTVIHELSYLVSVLTENFRFDNDSTYGCARAEDIIRILQWWRRFYGEYTKYYKQLWIRPITFESV
jgi:hypothetical protein